LERGQMFLLPILIGYRLILQEMRENGKGECEESGRREFEFYLFSTKKRGR